MPDRNSLTRISGPCADPPSPLAHEAALTNDGSSSSISVSGSSAYLVASLDALGIGLDEVVGGKHGDVGVVEDGVLDGRGDRQPVTAGGQVELGQRNPGGIGRDDVVVQLDPAAGTWSPRLVAGWR